MAINVLPGLAFQNLSIVWQTGDGEERLIGLCIKEGDLIAEQDKASPDFVLLEKSI